jgi:glycosyltransferase involved in cell wall biosynthesis
MRHLAEASDVQASSLFTKPTAVAEVAPPAPLALYALHSSRLYGTERMALATLEGLRSDRRPMVLAPRGPVLDEAERLGIAAIHFGGRLDFCRKLAGILKHNERIDFFATGVVHSLAFGALNAVFRRPGQHFHVVHGGTDERESYGRKRILNRFAVSFVAVSAFVKGRLQAHGVPAERVSVIENFLSRSQRSAIPQRPPFRGTGVEKIVVVSRLDPIKRVDLLLDAWDRSAELHSLSVDVLGTGWDLESLRERAHKYPKIRFRGFESNVGSVLAEADLLVHLCPVEPFGLAILESMAAGVPVLVPDSGGAGTLVEDGVSGFRFRADDAESLIERLLAVRDASAETMNAVVARARESLQSRFSEEVRIEEYRNLLQAWKVR